MIFPTPFSLCLALVALGGCAHRANPVVVPSPAAAQTAAAVQAPIAWQTPLPHGGSTSTLAQWWAQLGDPLLPELIGAAQTHSANLAAARTRIAQARAAMVGAQAGLLPTVNASGQTSRAAQVPGVPAATSIGAGVQASWELDVWGGTRAARNAATLRLENAQLGWHEARVLVAAETAATYFNLRHCEATRALSQADAASRSETARLNTLSAQAGLNAPANAALARASAADANANVRANQAQCQLLVKALVALSQLPEPVLFTKLLPNTAKTPAFTAQAAIFSVASIPAQVLQQRPDIVAAQRAIAAAQQDVAATDARRLPSISLSGNIGLASVRQGGGTQDGLTWSLGPVAISMPLFDQGRNAANTMAASAVYDEAVLALRAKVAQAVREVEEALVSLDSIAARQPDVQAAASGYQQALNASQARYRAGLANLNELEDTRRIALASQNSQLALERERIAAWINLYRAAGGGWDGQLALPASAAATPPLPTSQAPALPTMPSPITVQTTQAGNRP